MNTYHDDHGLNGVVVIPADLKILQMILDFWMICLRPKGFAWTATAVPSPETVRCSFGMRPFLKEGRTAR